MKCYRGWPLLGVIMVMLFLFRQPIERFSDGLLYAPWAYGWGDKGFLTGDWTGTLPDGRLLDITLERETDAEGLPTASDGADARLVGSGQVCGGREAAVVALQSSSNRSGSKIKLLFLSGEVAIGQLNGKWLGETLELSGTLFDQLVAVTLNRGSDCS